MRIGYVLKKFPRISETFILNEILELERQGAEVTIFSTRYPDDGAFHEKLAKLGKPVVYMPVRKSSAFLEHLRGNVDLLRRGRQGIWDEFEDLIEAGHSDVWSVLAWGIDIAIEAERRGIQHLHAHFATVATYVARTAHAITGIPYSFTCHAKDIYREGVDPVRFQKLAAGAAFAVTVCDANKQHIDEKLIGNEKLRVVSLYNGIHLDEFHPRHRKPDARPLVLGVGRLVEKKGFTHLISAAGGLLRAGLDLKCVIVGEGDLRPQLEAQIRELKTDRIELLGMRTQGEVKDLFTRAAMVVLPCVIGADGNRDALPTVLLEAMASGVPVISTPVVGVEEIVDGGRSGVLVPMDDPDALQAAMARLLHEEDTSATLARRGRERAESLFDIQKNVGTLLRLFENGASGGIP